MLRLILNVIWLVLSGFWLALAYAFFGVLLCITIVGFPFGYQLFKMAGYALWPFGRTVVKRSADGPTLSTVGNILWLPGGLIIAIVHVVSAIASAITIIGIPFAIANLKMAWIAFTPFGRVIMDRRDVPEAQWQHAV